MLGYIYSVCTYKRGVVALFCRLPCKVGCTVHILHSAVHHARAVIALFDVNFFFQTE